MASNATTTTTTTTTRFLADGPLPSPRPSSGPTRLKITHKRDSSNVEDREAHLNNRDQINMARIREETLKSRAKNVTKNYDPKQREFRNWTRAEGYPDGDTVTSEKLLSFLKMEVVSRPLRKKKKNAVTILNDDGQLI
jgi:hypothetical protein